MGSKNREEFVSLRDKLLGTGPATLKADRWSILLLEDDDVDQMLIERMICTWPQPTDVLVAHNLHRARDLLHNQMFDCVLADVGLPDGNGLSLVREPGCPPVVVLTRHQERTIAIDALREGVQDYLVKGEFDHEQLQRSVRYAVEMARLRTQLVAAVGELQHTVKRLESANLALERMARRDGLTRLLNRRAFDEALQSLVQEAHRGRRFALVMLDLDHFKKINDTHGHQVGDLVLRQVASCLLANCREIDYAARYGGEEMALLLVDVTQEEALEVAERLRQELSTHLHMPCAVTASFGVSLSRGPETDIDQLLRRTDEALYRAKAAGRDCVRVG